MAIIYKWIVEQMETYPEKDDLENVVFSVHWRVNASEGNYNATNYGSVGIELDKDQEEFVSYSELTEDDVVEWVKNALGEEQVEQIETGLSGQIAHLKNPPVVRPPLPW